MTKSSDRDRLARICVVTTSFPRYEGDYAGRRIHDLVEALSSKYETHVIFLEYPSSTKGAGGDCKQFYVHPIRCPSGTYSLAQTSALQSLGLMPVFISMLLKIRRVVENHNIDLIHAHWAIPAGFLASLGCRGIPIVTTLRGTDIKIFGKKRMFKYPIKYALKRAARIVALSNDLKREAINLGARDEKICIIPGGVDTNKFKPMDKHMARSALGLSEGFVILFVGNLIKLKGVDKLIKIGATLSHDFAFQLLVVGDGPERANLEDLARRVRLQNITFRGRVSYGEMPLYMAASDVLVLPSQSEGLPGCVQEAMACGIPVVASNVGGLPDLVTNGVNGYLFDSEEEMEARLRLMLSSPSLIEAMGANCLDFARQNLSLDMVVKRTEKLYASVLRRS